MLTAGFTTPLRQQVREAVRRARHLRALPERPLVTSQERKRGRCPLAPVCLPEEERVPAAGEARPRLFPEDDVRQVLHVTVPGARVGRDAEQLVVAPPEGAEEVQVPVRTVSALIVHGGVQVSSQAMALCVHHAIGVHWFTSGGRYLGGAGRWRG